MYTYILFGGGIIGKKSEYGQFLTELIKSKKISQSQFYQDLKIAKPYFYDIIGGKVNPPPSETQIKISEYLQLKQDEMIKLFDIAAKERDELPLDVVLYLKSNGNIEKIRNRNDYFRTIGGKIKCQKN